MTDKTGQLARESRRESPERDALQDIELTPAVAEYIRQLEASRNELARERDLLHTILDQAGDGVVAVDAQGHFLHWNQRAAEILGMGPDDLPSDNWPDHYGLYRPSGELLAADDLPLVRALRGETVNGQELLVRNPGQPDGRRIEVYARPLGADSPVPNGAIALLMDVEDIRRRHEQHRLQSREQSKIGRLALVGQVVDTATHRLSQPLAAIANYAAAAQQLHANDRLDDKRLKEILDHISRLAERGAMGLEALRALTRRGGRPYGRVDTNAVALAALTLLEEPIQARGIAVETQLAPEPPMVLGRGAELQQAVAHLLLNAVEAISAGHLEKRRLILTTALIPEHGGRVRIEVADNGPGIPAELHDTLFEPWVTSKPEALGLGLSVARGIAQSHLGDVILGKYGDEGLTRFTIELPAAGDEVD